MRKKCMEHMIKPKVQLCPNSRPACFNLLLIFVHNLYKKNSQQTQVMEYET